MIGAPSWLHVAHKELRDSVEESVGPEHDPRVLEYHSTTTLAASTDEVPWCSSFVNWCLREAGLPGTNSARARSWLFWGRSINLAPALGCLVVLRRGGGNQPGPEILDAPGHVGFYLGDAGLGRILVLGGNQHNAVCIQLYQRADVLGFRWP